jgi:hypothetical protein
MVDRPRAQVYYCSNKRPRLTCGYFSNHTGTNYEVPTKLCFGQDMVTRMQSKASRMSRREAA